jgi:hypothetical protein
MAPETSRELRSIRLIGPDLRKRLVTPCGSMTFYYHLIGGVIIFGGIGMFYGAYKSNWKWEEVSAHLLGYFFALIGAAVVEFTAEDQMYLRSFGGLALAVFGVLGLGVGMAGGGLQLGLAIFAAILAVLFWWVANGLNPRFNDVKTENAIGGDLSTKLERSQDTGWER